MLNNSSVKSLLFILTILITFGFAVGQNDTTKVEDLLSELGPGTETKLLPDKMIITQRILWGQKGLMRNFSPFELTPEKRQAELNLRRTMLKVHQAVGFVTLAGMIGQGIVGARLYNGEYQLKDTHEMLALGINTGYFTTAGLSLFAPPKAVDERKGFSSIKVHRWLAVLHMSGMILTNVLADGTDESNTIRSLHRASAFTAFGAYAASIIVIKF